MSAASSLSTVWAARRRERELLLASLACLTLGFVLALASRHQAGLALSGADLMPLVLYAGSLVLLHLGLVATGHRGDQALVVVTAFLLGIGLLAQARMGAFEGSGGLIPALWVLPLGVAALLAAAVGLSGGRFEVLGRIPWVWGGLSVVLVGLLLATGERFRGAVYGAGLVTPTEVLKITAVLFTAAFVATHQRALSDWHPRWPVLPRIEPLWRLVALWALLAGLLVAQRDLGQVVILGAALMVILVAGTGRLGYLAYGAALAAGLGWGLLALFEHGQRRIDAWLDPFADPTGDGWQVLQGLSGMYAGGLWGEGFGRGNPGYTPIAESDFIYTVIGEELGFVGTLVVVLFFLALFQRGIVIARAHVGLGRLIAAGAVTVLAVQTFLNLAGVTKLIPLTGVTLPLISRGGASLVTTCVLIGLLLAVSDAPRSGAGKSRGRARGGGDSRAGRREAAEPEAETDPPRPRKPRAPAGGRSRSRAGSPAAPG